MLDLKMIEEIMRYYKEMNRCEMGVSYINLIFYVNSKPIFSQTVQHSEYQVVTSSENLGCAVSLYMCML